MPTERCTRAYVTSWDNANFSLCANGTNSPRGQNDCKEMGSAPITRGNCGGRLSQRGRAMQKRRRRMVCGACDAMNVLVARENECA